MKTNFRVGLHNIYYSAHSLLAISEEGESGTRGGTSLVAPLDFSVKPFLRVLRRGFPGFCFSDREAVCADVCSSWPVVVVRSWLRSLPRAQRHAWELAIAPHRLYLRCVTCRQETPGWALIEPRPVAGRIIPFEWSTKFAAKRLPG